MPEPIPPDPSNGRDADTPVNPIEQKSSPDQELPAVENASVAEEEVVPERIWEPGYPKHRQAKAETWNNGDAKKWSVHGVAQYNPLIYDEGSIPALELRCITHGVQFKKTGNIEKYFLATDHIVGVCSGEETNLVYTQIDLNGRYHGRPISRKKLRAMGANPP